MGESKYLFVEHERPFKYEEDGLNVTRGSAWSGPGCHLGCGVLLYTDAEGKLVKVEGDPENPYNQGRLCPRCLALPEVTNHEDRLKYPMKRAKEDRGQNKWTRITWDEAFDTIERELKDIKQKYGPETVLFMQGTGRDIAPYITRLCWSYGSPNFSLFLSGAACYVPRVIGLAGTFGAFLVPDCSQVHPDRYDNPEYVIPEVIFVWGNNCVVSNSDGFFGHWVVDLMQRGSKIVVIDPRVTWLSSRAALHLRVRPGTDAALALGMLNVIISEELYDYDFVDKWCYGFDELAQRVKEYPVEKVAEITWIPEEKIVAAARMLATSKPAALQWGVAVDMTKEAIPAGQSISTLFAITGNIEVPGGMIVPPEILKYVGGWGKDLLPDDAYTKRIGQDRYPLFASEAQPDCIVEQLETSEPYKIRAAWIQTSNFLACMAADPQRLFNAMKDLDFIAYVDIFMTPTAMALADIVLPAATYPERNGIRLGDGAQRGETINKVTSIGECKSDMEINLELGRRLNPEAWPWDTVEEMFTFLLQDDTGMTFEELQEQAPAYPPFQYRRHEKGLLRKDGQLGFNTATGRIELWSTFYSNVGLDPLPYFEEPTPGPGSTPELLEEYPLVLTTGARNWSMFHSEHRQIKRMRALHPDPIVEVNPKTLEKFGIADGGYVWVENQYGRAKRKVRATEAVDERMCSTDHAWWLPEGDPDKLYSVFDLNINNLVQWSPGKSGFGSNYKTALCRIYPVNESE
ncbi:molybdopterin-dependent oxidoreductase [Adlercreutzia sp. ZJ304]|uniref:molybdopterin-dependent oxidoreductase n=1 Tax=Adlercreutzia sp. ZJ304 TaxID=2709791 RepID=UPI0013EDD655|nr:molybdopterin-dependent oxidoreductase [Adlercreutzia sp. ZJ304]